MGNTVRLKVPFETPQALIAEVSRSVGRGGVRIESKRTLPVGTRFVFEMYARGLKQSVEVYGTVLSASETSPGLHSIHIRYDPPVMRQGLDMMLEKIVGLSAKRGARSDARIPLQIRAVEDRKDSPIYRLRDIAEGGLGLDVEGDKVPAYVQPGISCTFRMRLKGGILTAVGTVTWASREIDHSRAAIGVQFGVLSGKELTHMRNLVSLKGLAHPPWIARLEFGEMLEDVTI